MLNLITKNPWIPIKFKDLWAQALSFSIKHVYLNFFGLKHFNPTLQPPSVFPTVLRRSSHLTPALFSKKHLNYWIPTAPGTHVFPQGIALSQPTLPSQQIIMFFVFFCFSCFLFVNPWDSMHPLGKREVSGPCKNHETFLTRGVVLSSPDTSTPICFSDSASDEVVIWLLPFFPKNTSTTEFQQPPEPMFSPRV